MAKVDSKFLLTQRKKINLNQADMAKEIGIHPKTYWNAEHGFQINDESYNQIKSFLVTHPTLNPNGTLTESIKSYLKKGSSQSKNIGSIKTNFVESEKEKIIPYSHNKTGNFDLPTVTDPYFKFNPKNDDPYGAERHATEEDYVWVQKSATEIENSVLGHDLLLQFGSMKNAIWKIDENIPNIASHLKKLEITLKSIRKVKDQTSLEGVIKIQELKDDLHENLLSLKKLDIKIFMGMQVLHTQKNPIFFLVDSGIKYLTYQVEIVHPRFMKKIYAPFYTFLKRDGMNYLIRRPYVWSISDEENPHFDERMTKYPNNEEEVLWIKHCEEIRSSSKISEKNYFNAYIFDALEEILHFSDTGFYAV